MLTHEIRNQLLVDELQLGNRLNQDIQTSDHADFARREPYDIRPLFFRQYAGRYGKALARG